MTSDFIRVHNRAPFFLLKTQETLTEPLAPFVFLTFEVLGPDVFDTVICLSSASSSSELITISSHAFSCSKDRIHSICSCNLFAWFGKPFTFDSLFKQNEFCRLRLTFFARSTSSIDSLALVLSLDTLPTLFHPVVIEFWWVSKGLLRLPFLSLPGTVGILSDASSCSLLSPYTTKMSMSLETTERTLCGSIRA